MRKTLEIFGWVVTALFVLLQIFEFGNSALTLLRTRVFLLIALIPTAGAFLWCIWSILKAKKNPRIRSSQNQKAKESV